MSVLHFDLLHELYLKNNRSRLGVFSNVFVIEDQAESHKALLELAAKEKPIPKTH